MNGEEPNILWISVNNNIKSMKAKLIYFSHTLIGKKIFIIT